MAPCSAQPRKNGATQNDPQHCWKFTLSRTSSRLRAVNPTTSRHTTQALHNTSVFVWNLYCVRNSDRQCTKYRRMHKLCPSPAEHFQPIFIEEKLCICGYAEVLSPQKYFVGKSQIRKLKKYWVRKSPHFRKVPLFRKFADLQFVNLRNAHLWVQGTPLQPVWSTWLRDGLWQEPAPPPLPLPLRATLLSVQSTFHSFILGSRFTGCRAQAKFRRLSEKRFP